MIKATLIVLAVTTLAACEATMGPADPMAGENRAGADGADAADATPWWAV